MIRYFLGLWCHENLTLHNHSIIILIVVRSIKCVEDFIFYGILLKGSCVYLQNQIQMTRGVFHIIIWPVRPRAQFPWKTIREKVPYEGRTRRSDRAGKTRTALLEMRAALLETATAKSMQVNDKTNLLLPKFVLSKTNHESEHSESEFYHPGELPHAELLHQSPTHSKSRERNLTLLANEAHDFLRSQQANRRSRKQLFRINCPITNFWNKQTVARRNFFPWKASKNSS